MLRKGMLGKDGTDGGKFLRGLMIFNVDIEKAHDNVTGNFVVVHDKMGKLQR